MTYYLGMTRIDENVSRMTKRDRSGRSIPKQVMPAAGGDICRHKYVEHNLPFIEIYTRQSSPRLEVEENPKEEHNTTNDKRCGEIQHFVYRHVDTEGIPDKFIGIPPMI
jgi:hypothetical protein